MRLLGIQSEGHSYFAYVVVCRRPYRWLLAALDRIAIALRQSGARSADTYIDTSSKLAEKLESVY